MRELHDLEAYDEDFEKMIMLQEEEDPQLRQGVLDLFRSKSTYETTKHGESSAFNSKSN